MSRRAIAVSLATAFLLAAACGGRSVESVSGGGSASSSGGATGGSGGAGGSGGGVAGSSGSTGTGSSGSTGTGSSGGGGTGSSSGGSGSSGSGGTGSGGGAFDAGGFVDGGAGCPASPPAAGSPCVAEGASCDWSAQGCDERCLCESGQWFCNASSCPCPSPAPQHGDPCSFTNQVCSYPIGGNCRVDECFCTSGEWICGPTDCPESGIVPETGVQECPTSQPSPATHCPTNGAVCSYGNCINCLCVSGDWTCAALPPPCQ
jgi:hypothetical protein